MPESKHLRNAPITEALFDFRVKARKGFHPEAFAALQAQISGRFPQMDEHHRQQMTFGANQEPVIKDPVLHGYFFKTSDEKTIAQFRIDGFTLNKLRPYSSWEVLFPQAMELWRLYVSIAEPEVITRLAVRYINRIPLPSGEITLQTYLTAAPAVPQGLPQSLSHFFTRLTIREPKTSLSANIQQTLEVLEPGMSPTILLDIDVYKESEFEIDDPAIEETFSQMRVFKNSIFFKSITDEALRQFE